MTPKQKMAAAVVISLALLVALPSSEFSIVDHPNGATIIGDVPVASVPEAVWDSAQIWCAPGGGLVVGARFLPWGEGVFDLPEIDAPTLDAAIGSAGDYSSTNSAWGLLSWHYDRGHASASQLLDVLIGEVAKRGCSREVLDAFRRWASPRVHGWVRDRENAIG